MDEIKPKSKRGGARKNAGRKPENPGEAMTHKTITLDSMSLRKLLVLGDGEVSRGVRVAAEIAFDRYQRTDISRGTKTERSVASVSDDQEAA